MGCRVGACKGGVGLGVAAPVTVTPFGRSKKGGPEIRSPPLSSLLLLLLAEVVVILRGREALALVDAPVIAGAGVFTGPIAVLAVDGGLGGDLARVIALLRGGRRHHMTSPLAVLQREQPTRI